MVTTQAGAIGLRIPKLRKASFFPVILEPGRRIDQALYAVVMKAYAEMGPATISSMIAWCPLGRAVLDDHQLIGKLGLLQAALQRHA